MGGCAESGSVPMSFERNDVYGIEVFRQGEFDYWEGVGEVCEGTFSGPLRRERSWRSWWQSILRRVRSMMFRCGCTLAAASPCGFMGSIPSMRFPMWYVPEGWCKRLARRWGIGLSTRRREMSRFAVRGLMKRTSMQTPCDPDYLRKMARWTDAQLLLAWFNRDVVGIFQQHHVFDREGIFIGDAL